MMTRENVLLVVGAAAVLLGGATFLSAFGDEPMWVEWLLGPAVAFGGVATVIAGVALHCYCADSATPDRPVGTAVAAKRGP
jgi:hypothetical protein